MDDQPQQTQPVNLVHTLDARLERLESDLEKKMDSTTISLTTGQRWVFVTVILPWCLFISLTSLQSQFFMQSGERFTAQDGMELEMRVDKRIDGLPPQDWRDKIDKLDLQNEALRSSISQLHDIIIELRADLKHLQN